jgi:hypothetical protein
MFWRNLTASTFRVEESTKQVAARVLVPYSAYSSNLKMEAVCYFRIWVHSMAFYPRR